MTHKMIPEIKHPHNRKRISKLVPIHRGIPSPVKKDISHLPNRDIPPYPVKGNYERRARYFKEHWDMELPRWWTLAQARSLAMRKGCLLTNITTEEDILSEEFKQKELAQERYNIHKAKKFNKKYTPPIRQLNDRTHGE